MFYKLGAIVFLSHKIHNSVVSIFSVEKGVIT